MKSACRSTSTFQKRLARCREALLGDVPVTKVYLLFGFHDYSSFYRAFKKSTGSRRRILKNCIPLPAINTVVPNALFTFVLFRRIFNMFQMWGKLVKNNHILQDLTVCIDDEDTRTHKGLPCAR